MFEESQRWEPMHQKDSSLCSWRTCSALFRLMNSPTDRYMSGSKLLLLLMSEAEIDDTRCPELSTTASPEISYRISWETFHERANLRTLVDMVLNAFQQGVWSVHVSIGDGFRFLRVQARTSAMVDLVYWWGKSCVFNDWKQIELFPIANGGRISNEGLGIESAIQLVHHYEWGHGDDPPLLFNIPIRIWWVYRDSVEVRSFREHL